MGKKQTRNILIAVAAVLTLLALAYWYWYAKDTVKLTISGITIVDGAAALTVATTSTSNPSLWAGKKITVHTKSLGKFHTTVASASMTNGAGVVTTAANAYTGAAAYAFDKGDYARVLLKY